LEFSGRHGESCWRFSASRYTAPVLVFSTSDFHEIACRENSEKGFAFEGEVTGFTNVKITLYGGWIADLPNTTTETISDN
jgi:hypothetical protein